MIQTSAYTPSDTPYSISDEDLTPAQQMAKLMSPVDAASLLQGGSASGAAASGGGGATTGSSAPASVLKPGTVPAVSGGRAALAALGSAPQLDTAKIEQLQQQRNTDATPLNPNAQQYRPGVGTKIRRGVAAFFAEGIPGALLSNYNAPNRQFSIDDQARQARLGQDQAQLADVQSNFKDRLDAYNRQRQAAGEAVKADKNDVTASTKEAARLALLAKNGLKEVDDGQGNKSIVDDENSEAFKDKKTLNELRQTTEELKQAQTAVENAKNDPNSPSFKQAQQRLQVAMAGHQAATLAAQARWGNYQLHAHGTDLQGNTLPGATELPDGTPVGTAFAPTVNKQQPKVAQFNDVHGALDSLENSAKALVKSGGKLNSPGVVAALADPKSTSSQYLQGLVAKGQLTPAERDYVVANAAAHENLMALRSSVGGGVSDTQVHQLLSLLPNASTPDLDYALRQTGQIRATANRLGQGLPNVHGGRRVRGSDTPQENATPAASQIPAAAAAQLQEGVQHTFGNGQVWTKQNGKPVRIK